MPIDRRSQEMNAQVFRYGAATAPAGVGLPEIPALESPRMRRPLEPSIPLVEQPAPDMNRESFVDPGDPFQEFPRTESEIPPTEGGAFTTGWRFNRLGGLSLEVVADDVYTQGYIAGGAGAFVPADETLTLADDTTNYIYLTIGRDATSRELSTGVIESFVTVQTSTDTAEYHLIAVADTADGVIVYIEIVRHSEIKTLEEIVVVNGELKYLPMEMSVANWYDIPPPP